MAWIMFSTLAHTHSRASVGLLHEPRLHELQCLRVKQKKIRVMKTVAASWRQVAIALHFEGSVIEIISESARSYPEPACEDMFRRWLRGEGRGPITWDTLIESLEDAEFENLADDLRKSLKEA